MLNDRDRQTVEQRLKDERERVLESLRDFDETREQSLQEAAGELSAYPAHMADVGTDAMEQEKQYLLASNDGRRLYEIDEALRRLYAESDRFGVCERCGEAIGMERLEVVPEAVRCAACQRLSED